MLAQEISRYQIINKIGEGDMGIVYKAFDRLFNRHSALKFPTLAAQDDDARARFHREAEAASKVRDRNVCQVFDTGEMEGRTYIAMEYLEGKTLDVVIACGPRPAAEALTIVLQVARGLAAIHQAGVVHRDIKPANIMLTKDRGAVIFDFGLAYEPGTPRITGIGRMAGTLAFMSPEQALGQPLDHRTDIWSAGVLLYSLLTGRLPFDGGYDEEIFYSLVNEDPEPLPPCGTGEAARQRLQQIINRALAKQPTRRFATASAFAEALRTAFRIEPLAK